ncbi:hypothetical protein QTG54_006348, partial [Skeletonema marinoi]
MMNMIQWNLPIVRLMPMDYLFCIICSRWIHWCYPTLLAETASTALGRKQDISTLVSASKTGGGAMGSGIEAAKKDGITAILIKSSDFLQRRLRVSASASYYIIAASGILSLCVLPTTIGVMYQGFQRLQIDKSEMKMYGKIADMDATSKRVTDDDDDDD